MMSTMDVHDDFTLFMLFCNATNSEAPERSSPPASSVKGSTPWFLNPFAAVCDHEIIFVYGFALDGGTHCVKLLQGESGDVANCFFFDLAVFAVTMP